uniref:SDR family NAD(P)-dependent oxidoreductase n=1 Tax=Paractinoplanes polyasparticus TaxID=2856853 RepID=UPI001C841025|nr:SDR family NAD(P)-dependent oxidoreductase [Actinoplanes polyasparticus]
MKTAVVTGAAGGLGRALVTQLVDAGFEVVAVTRRETTAYGVHALHADLLVRDEIDALSARVRDTVPHVDVLINNAGAAFPHYAETPDGAERTHALNHLAPFQLTHRLLANGSLAPGARIITIASDLISRGRLDAGHPDVTGTSWRTNFSQLTVYGTAKLAAVLATSALADRLPEGMTTYSANPGVIRTGFNAKAGGLLRLVSAVANLFAAAPEKAARTPVRLATAATRPGPSGSLVSPGKSVDVNFALADEVYEHTARALGLTPLVR